MHWLEGFTSPTLAHKTKAAALKHFLVQVREILLDVHQLFLSMAIPPHEKAIFTHSPEDYDIKHGSCAGLSPVHPSLAASSLWA